VQQKAVFRHAVETSVLLVSPFAPHVAEELWRELGYSGSILEAAWPEADTAAMDRESVELVVQVNGKVRAHMRVPVNMDRTELETMVLGNDQVRRHTEGKTVRRIVVVPDKLVNIAVS
jgi:leucyl-tRNA synthetase